VSINKQIVNEFQEKGRLNFQGPNLTVIISKPELYTGNAQEINEGKIASPNIGGGKKNAPQVNQKQGSF
jgi:hypothetical protein